MKNLLFKTIGFIFIIGLFTLGFAQMDVDTTAVSAEELQDASSGVNKYVNWAWKGDFKPYFEFAYGMSQPEQNKFTGTFAKAGLFELQIGLNQTAPYKDYSVTLDQRYLFFDVLSDDISPVAPESNEIITKATRFGFGNRLGYGYNASVFDLIPYNQMQYLWTNTEFSNTENLSEEDLYILNRYAGTFRFGQSGEAGLKFAIGNLLSVNAGYEFAVVLPRFIFWEWLGSQVLMNSALGIVSNFSEEIVDFSPVLGPVTYFLLKNGLAYAFYLKMKDDMNWPFSSEAPLTIESFKIGISLTL